MKITNITPLNDGMAEDEATELFDKVEKFAAYSFNKSHSASYSILTMWAAYIKAHYPAEFFAAQLTTVDDETKIRALVRDAGDFGIQILPPDINISGDTMKIVGNNLYAPFKSAKGLSDKTSAAILEARERKFDKHGTRHFDSFTDFMLYVDKRRVNKRHQAVLEAIGAFASITPGSPPIDDESRLRDQVTLLPGIMLRRVMAERKLNLTTPSIASLRNVMADIKVCQGCDQREAPHAYPKPHLGAKVMVVLETVPKRDIKSKVIAQKKDDSLTQAIEAAGLSLEDCYITTLFKAAKPDPSQPLSSQQFNSCKEFLKREIALLKPAVIVALGNAVARYFVPSLEGGILDNEGQVHYDPELDASIVIGITPGMIYFDPAKQNLLDAVFDEVASLTAKL